MPAEFWFALEDVVRALGAFASALFVIGLIAVLWALWPR